jgi:hypothetical protein
MKTSSAKSKGRRGAAAVKELLHRHALGLKDGDILVTPSGVTGPDLHLSPAAFEVFPFAVESKNQENISIWKSIEQSQQHTKKLPGSIATLFFKRNRSELMVCLKAEDFVRLIL